MEVIENIAYNRQCLRQNKTLHFSPGFQTLPIKCGHLLVVKVLLPECSGRIENERKRNKRLGKKTIAKQREDKTPAIVYSPCNA